MQDTHTVELCYFSACGGAPAQAFNGSLKDRHQEAPLFTCVTWLEHRQGEVKVANWRNSATRLATSRPAKRKEKVGKDL